MSAMDITVQAMSGSASCTREPDGPPTKAGAAFVDFSGGIHLFGDWSGSAGAQAGGDHVGDQARMLAHGVGVQGVHRG